MIIGTKVLFARLPRSPVEAHREAQPAAVGLGEASALLAELSGKSGSLARAPAIRINYCEDACGRRAAERANRTVVSNKS